MAVQLLLGWDPLYVGLTAVLVVDALVLFYLLIRRWP